MRTCEKPKHHLVASRNVLRMEKVSVETEDLHHVGEAIDLVHTHKLLAAGKVMATLFHSPAEHSVLRAPCLRRVSIAGIGTD